MISLLGVNLTSAAQIISSFLALSVSFARVYCAYPLDFFYMHRVYHM